MSSSRIGYRTKREQLVPIYYNKKFFFFTWCKFVFIDAYIHIYLPTYLHTYTHNISFIPAGKNCRSISYIKAQPETVHSILIIQSHETHTHTHKHLHIHTHTHSPNPHTCTPTHIHPLNLHTLKYQSKAKYLANQNWPGIMLYDRPKHITQDRMGKTFLDFCVGFTDVIFLLL